MKKSQARAIVYSQTARREEFLRRWLRFNGYYDDFLASKYSAAVKYFRYCKELPQGIRILGYQFANSLKFRRKYFYGQLDTGIFMAFEKSGCVDFLSFLKKEYRNITDSNCSWFIYLKNLEQEYRNVVLY